MRRRKAIAKRRMIARRRNMGIFCSTRSCHRQIFGRCSVSRDPNAFSEVGYSASGGQRAGKCFGRTRATFTSSSASAAGTGCRHHLRYGLGERSSPWRRLGPQLRIEPDHVHQGSFGQPRQLANHQYQYGGRSDREERPSSLERVSSDLRRHRLRALPACGMAGRTCTERAALDVPGLHF